MPFSYRVDPVGMIYLQGWGPPDRESWLETMDQLRGDERFGSDVPLLMDFVAIAYPPEPGLATTLAADLRRLVAGHRVAIVAVEASYDVARQVSLLLPDQEVAAFRDLDAARQWLLRGAQA